MSAALNEAHAHNWAAVAAWGGKSGPLICWNKPGEEKRLNGASVFGRFYWAARGKVGPTRRWKTPSKIRRLLTFFIECFDFTLVFWVFEPSDGFTPSFKWCKATYEGNDPEISDARFERRQKYESALKHMISFDSEELFKDLEEHSVIKLFSVALEKIENDTAHPVFLTSLANDRRFCVYLLYIDRRDILLKFYKLLKVPAIYLVKLFERFRKEAYRSHLLQKVRPSPRRHRIRRPLCARPRPPSAPLAPPLR